MISTAKSQKSLDSKKINFYFLFLLLYFHEPLESVSEIFVKNTTSLNFVFLENKVLSDSKVNETKEEPFVTFQL